MSRNSSRIKAKHKEGFCLATKTPDFFLVLSELYRIFSKMTEFMGVGGLFINFVCLYVAQKTTSARL